MTDKELKKLSRIELLEMLVEISKENEILKDKMDKVEADYKEKYDNLRESYENKISEMQKKLDDKKIAIGKVGSIAEACLQINGIFEAAQASAEQYLENVRNSEALCREMEKTAEEESQRKMAETEAEISRKMAKAEADAMVCLEKSRAKAAQVIAEAETQSKRMITEAETKSATYWDTVSQKLTNFYTEHQGLRELLNMNNGNKNI